MRKRKNRIITSAILISVMLFFNGCTADEQVLFVASTEAFAKETDQLTETGQLTETNSVAEVEGKTQNTDAKTDSLKQEGTLETESDVSEESRKITVHVCGAVKKAGVFKLEEGSRVMDAVLAAGGFSNEADEEYVNLATLLSDGDKVKIPTKEEVTELESAGKKESDNGVIRQENLINTQADTYDRVNINTADKEELCTLPGIGQTRAESILAYRNAHGDFSKIEDIMQVSGIKDSCFQKIKERITVK